MITRFVNAPKMTPCVRLVVAAIGLIGLGLRPVHSTERAHSVERTAVTEVKPLLMVAAERGEAYGVLGGPGADYVRRRFNTDTPIEIDVRRLHTLPQPGCGRLEVTSRQRAVLESASRHDQTLTYQVSFCSDGNFPEKPK
jgi:hypothetical protein